MSNATTDGRTTTGPGTTAKDEARALPRRLGLDPAHLARGKAALASLDASAPDAGAGEKIVHELVAGQFALALAIADAQAEVVARLAYFLDDPRSLSILARALRELTTLGNAVGRRIEGGLTTASGLRAQRRLWNIGRS